MSKPKIYISEENDETWRYLEIYIEDSKSLQIEFGNPGVPKSEIVDFGLVKLMKGDLEGCDYHKVFVWPSE